MHNAGHFGKNTGCFFEFRRDTIPRVSKKHHRMIGPVETRSLVSPKNTIG